MTMSYKSVSIVGLGYIGLPTAAVLASRIGNVIGVDVNQNVVDAVNAGKAKTVEPGLATLLEIVTTKGYLRAVLQPEPADTFIIAVPTPLTPDHKPDMSYVQTAVLSIASVLRKGNLVILESTSPVGTTEQIAQWFADERPDLFFPQHAGEMADIQIAYCPERILPGKMLEELVYNDRIVGGMTAKASEMATELYRLFVQGEIITTTVCTAELCKLVENSFRDVNIAFANELSMLCDKLDIDVWELIRLANRHPRVKILQPGCGVGGHCIPVDPWFIVDSTSKETRLIRTAREINDNKPLWVLEKIKSAIADVLANNPEKSIADVTVAGLGLEFKADTNDLRESPALYIAENIARIGCRFLTIAPHIHTLPPPLSLLGAKLSTLIEALKEADIVCVLVRHTSFIEFAEEIAKHNNVIDIVGLFEEYNKNIKL